MEQSQGLFNQIQNQVAEERGLPAKVWEDSVNEKAEYEKEVLQGAGGLMTGGAVEKGFRALAKSPKGASALKKLGMSEEDVKGVIDAIKSRDTGALTDFLARKGTGFVESTAKKLGIKGGKVAKTTIKNLKDGKLPSRQELQNAINEGGGKEVKPSKSNLKKKPTEDGAGEDESQGFFDALQSKAENSIKSVRGSLQDAIQDLPSRVSNVADKGLEELKTKGFGRVNSAFDRARADGVDDLEGQSEAVKKLLGNSKRGRKLLRKNAKSKADGEPAEPPKKPTTEFDAEDEQGDYFTELTKLGKKGKRMISKAKEELPSEATEVNQITGQEVNPLARIRAGKQKIEKQLKETREQIQDEAGRDPYQDVYDQANREAQRFTPDELGKGTKLEKDLDFKFQAPTREEHLEQLAKQEKLKEPMNITDENDADLTDAGFDSKPTIPASEQTGGIDPSTLPENAGYQRGGSKIKAKKEVEPRAEEPQPEIKINNPFEEDITPSYTAGEEALDKTVSDIKNIEQTKPTIPEPPKSEPDDIDDFINKTKIPKPPQQEEDERLSTEQETPKPPEPELNPPKPLEPVDKPPINEPPKTKPNLEGDGGETKLNTTGEDVEDGIKGAFEDSLEADEDPFGIILSGILGIGALIGGAVKRAHHPHFIQPPALHPYENFSVQEGVA